MPTFFRNEAGGSAIQISAGSASLMGFEASGTGTADVFLQLFKLPSASVSLGVTAPAQSYLIPGASSTNRGAVDRTYAADRLGRSALHSVGGLSYAITATPTGGGTPAGTVTANFWYHG